MSAPPRQRRSLEPFVWLLFSGGGMAAALVLPILVVLFGVAFPLGWLDAPDYAHLFAVLGNPLTKLVLFGVFLLALFHWAHRFRFTVEHGLKLGRFDPVIALCCYGAAAVGSVVAGCLLLGV
ncbi:fumarate reductase subunit FrdD [Mycobacterium talmoniae]|uniref:Fumarate reductase subunit D n=1 Tax=Mycobacterium talmoniae TaxID=1858794 RepID=A0A1S1N5P3_9MYCO|nr:MULTISPECIES: fumarate reductase subunit FrdD [Mycobacterium]OHU94626.1 fumarate reductase subunit D [Mycobacterium talmoniae]PQM45590.1 Fumarate reductase subunit D [Mycobacterium talmoniae]TDH48759.1 fumarate reductase subunit FrdD [Mycobacterium eburneum]